jgi:hypothetical protein
VISRAPSGKYRPHLAHHIHEQADGTFFIAQAYHCAVATKPG